MESLFLPAPSLPPMRTALYPHATAHRPRWRPSPRHTLLSARLGPTNNNPSPPADYAHLEGLDDAEASSSMPAWNFVIHASLERKLQNLNSGSRVAAGISSLLRAAKGYIADGGEWNGVGEDTAVGAVEEVLGAFESDVRRGAKRMIELAGEENFVRRASADGLLLFVADTGAFRPLLFVERFECEIPRYAVSGAKCVVRVVVEGKKTGEEAVFEFLLGRCGSGWLVDEVFRL